MASDKQSFNSWNLQLAWTTVYSFRSQFLLQWFFGLTIFRTVCIYSVPLWHAGQFPIPEVEWSHSQRPHLQLYFQAGGRWVTFHKLGGWFRPHPDPPSGCIPTLIFWRNLPCTIVQLGTSKCSPEHLSASSTSRGLKIWFTQNLFLGHRVRDSACTDGSHSYLFEVQVAAQAWQMHISPLSPMRWKRSAVVSQSDSDVRRWISVSACSEFSRSVQWTRFSFTLSILHSVFLVLV